MMPVVWLSPSVSKPVGRQMAMPWEEIERHVHDPKAGQAKGSLWRWNFCEYRGAYRAARNLLRNHALMYDVDDGTTLAQLEHAFADLYVIVHSTFSATEMSPAWRVILPFDFPAESEDEHDRMWRWGAWQIERAGGKAETGAKSAAQPFAVPARPPHGFYTARVIEGAFANKSEALETIPTPKPLPIDEPRELADTYENRLSRASKYLKSMPGAISGSYGHKATFKAAVAMVRGFALTVDDAFRLLVTEYNPRCSPAWTEFELEHKVRQAYQRARMPFGALAERRRAA